MAYSIPRFKLSLVKDGSVKAESRTADSPGVVADIVRDYIGPTDREHFVALLVNARHEILGVETVSIGTLTASLVHPREIFAPAVEERAASVIVAHNHPSGELRPSAEDREATRRIGRAGRILGIPLLDHV